MVLPFSQYPDAVGVQLRRGVGEITVALSALYSDVPRQARAKAQGTTARGKVGPKTAAQRTASGRKPQSNDKKNARSAKTRKDGDYPPGWYKAKPKQDIVNPPNGPETTIASPRAGSIVLW